MAYGDLLAEYQAASQKLEELLVRRYDVYGELMDSMRAKPDILEDIIHPKWGISVSGMCRLVGVPYIDDEYPNFTIIPAMVQRGFEMKYRILAIPTRYLKLDGIETMQADLERASKA